MCARGVFVVCICTFACMCCMHVRVHAHVCTSDVEHAARAFSGAGVAFILQVLGALRTDTRWPRQSCTCQQSCHTGLLQTERMQPHQCYPCSALSIPGPYLLRWVRNLLLPVFMAGWKSTDRVMDFQVFNPSNFATKEMHNKHCSPCTN